MTSYVMRKHLGCLKPVDDAGTTLLSKIKLGADVMVEVKRPRNPLHHRKLFALAKIVADNSDVWPSTEAAITALKLATGHVETFAVPGGKVYEIPRSISFASMDQTAFDQFYDACVKVIVERFLPGVEEEALRNEVLEMLG